MAFQRSEYGDVYTSLAVSQEEARQGSKRVVTLPDGRTIKVQVPAGIQNEEEVRIHGQGVPVGPAGQVGDLILKVSVISMDRFKRSGPVYDEQILPGGSEWTHTGKYNAYASNPSISTYSSETTYAGATNVSDPALAADRTVGAGQQSRSFEQRADPAVRYPDKRRRRRHRRRSRRMTAATFVALLLLIVVSGLVFYFGYYQPHQVTIAASATPLSGTAARLATNTAVLATGTAHADATNSAQVQATAQAYQNIYTQATQGTPDFADAMSGQTARQWDVATSTANGSCGFSGGSYHARMATLGYFQPCFAQTSDYSNFAFQVTMSLSKGNSGGILFRADDFNSKYYLFRINANGNYDLFLYTGDQATQVHGLLQGSSAFIQPSGHSNQITVVAQGSNLYFYVNQKYLASLSDGTYTVGKIGVFGDSHTQVTDAAFSNIQVWVH